MRGIDYLGTLIMWLVVLIGWLIKGGKTNLLKEIAKIDDSAKRNVGIIFVIFFLGPIFLGECREQTEKGKFVNYAKIDILSTAH